MTNQQLWANSLIAVLFVGHASGLIGQSDDQPAVASSELGAVEGTVTYRADPKRPWRYARYYVQQAKTGEMAEAAVALRGKSLANRAARPPETMVIDQKNFLFIPEIVAIRQGDSVKFTNSDQATHNVQISSDLISFNVSMAGGGSHTASFERAGGVSRPLQVGCAFHSAMRAYVFVFDHPYYQVTSADGRFQLKEIPSGEYDLELAHPGGNLRRRQRVTVEAGKTLRVDIGLSPDDKK